MILVGRLSFGWVGFPHLWVQVTSSLLKLMSIESVMPFNHLILCHPLLFLPSIFPSIRVFSSEQFLTSGGQSIGASALASVLAMNIQDWFPLGLIGLIFQSKWLSRVFSTTIWNHQVFSSQPSLWSNSHITCIHDYWKNHSFDYTDLCWQSDVSASLVSDREF